MKFLNRQNRYAQLVRSSPAVAEKLQGELQAFWCHLQMPQRVFQCGQPLDLFVPSSFHLSSFFCMGDAFTLFVHTSASAHFITLYIYIYHLFLNPS